MSLYNFDNNKSATFVQPKTVLKIQTKLSNQPIRMIAEKIIA